MRGVALGLAGASVGVPAASVLVALLGGAASPWSWVGLPLFGAAHAAWNLWLAYGRPRAHLRAHGSLDAYTWASGVPGVSSVLGVLGVALGFGAWGTALVALVVAAVDPGGLPAFARAVWAQSDAPDPDRHDPAAGDLAAPARAAFLRFVERFVAVDRRGSWEAALRGVRRSYDCFGVDVILRGIDAASTFDVDEETVVAALRVAPRDDLHARLVAAAPSGVDLDAAVVEIDLLHRPPELRQAVLRDALARVVDGDFVEDGVVVTEDGAVALVIDHHGGARWCVARAVEPEAARPG